MLKLWLLLESWKQQVGNWKDLTSKHLEALRKDESGAALIEYSILIGLIAAAVIATIVLVSGWVVAAWTTLLTNLGPNPT